MAVFRYQNARNGIKTKAFYIRFCREKVPEIQENKGFQIYVPPLYWGMKEGKRYMNRVEKLLIKAQEISEIKRKERLRNMTDEELDNRIEQLRTELGISKEQYESPGFHSWLMNKVQQLRGELDEKN